MQIVSPPCRSRPGHTWLSHHRGNAIGYARRGRARRAGGFRWGHSKPAAVQYRSETTPNPSLPARRRCARAGGETSFIGGSFRSALLLHVMGHRYNRNELKVVRSALRAAATPSEATLWSALKGGQLGGRKFRRQHSIDAYVLDFYCPSERLAVELDGAVHRDPTRSANDQERDERLLALGIRVLRFTNDQVHTSLEGVLVEIAAHFKK